VAGVHSPSRAPGSDDRPTLLVVEDDEHARALAARVGRAEGLAVVEAIDGRRALEVLRARPIDLVLLDLGLPDRDGLALLGDIRRASRAITLVLSADARLETRVAGLRLGADDYMVKPVPVDELGARLCVALRRRVVAPATDGRVAFGPFVLDVRAHQVRRERHVVALTRREHALLAFLAQHPNQVFTRRQLLEAVWGTPWFDEATVTEHVRTLRTKLGAPAGRSPWITTVRGFGYRFDP
jgi:DNA-binding response OmpR family regulator